MSSPLRMFEKATTKSSHRIATGLKRRSSVLTFSATAHPLPNENFLQQTVKLRGGDLAFQNGSSIFLAVATFAMISSSLAAVSTKTSSEGKPPTKKVTSTMESTNNNSTDTTKLDDSTVNNTSLPENPLWPAGVTDTDVDELVESCLKDPSINIAAVPDYLERQIYRSTIKLTINAIYKVLADIHGQPIMGHEFRLKRVPMAKSELHKELFLLDLRSDVQEKVLEEVADRLMANKAINQRFIPDVIERQLYVNCLKIIFRLLDLIASSLQLTVCGHDLRFQLQPASSGYMEEAFSRASSSLTEIDLDLMKEHARQAGVDELETNVKRWFWQRMFDPCNNSLVANMHASLYSLVLGVLDDLLANTQLELLSDRIHFDIVPGHPQGLNHPRSSKADGAAVSSEKEQAHTVSKLPRILVFSAGVGVGLAVMALFGDRG